MKKQLENTKKCCKKQANTTCSKMQPKNGKRMSRRARFARSPATQRAPSVQDATRLSKTSAKPSKTLPKPSHNPLKTAPKPFQNHLKIKTNQNPAEPRRTHKKNTEEFSRTQQNPAPAHLYKTGPAPLDKIPC